MVAPSLRRKTAESLCYRFARKRYLQGSGAASPAEKLERCPYTWGFSMETEYDRTVKGRDEEKPRG